MNRRLRLFRKALRRKRFNLWKFKDRTKGNSQFSYGYYFESIIFMGVEPRKKCTGAHRYSWKAMVKAVRKDGSDCYLAKSYK